LALAALSPSVAAQEKGKAQKLTAGTVDAWRQALSPEAETTGTPEESSAVAQPRVTREAAEKALLALGRRWTDSLRQRDASVLSQLVSDDFALVSPRAIKNFALDHTSKGSRKE